MLVAVIILAVLLAVVGFVAFRASGRVHALEARAEVLTAERDLALAEATRRVDDARADAERDIERMSREAEARVALTRTDAEARITEIRSEAATRVDEIRREAEANAERVKAEADRRISEALAEAGKREEFQRANLLDLQTERFRTLASELLSSTSDSLKTESQQRLAELLTPLRENIEQFRQSVSESYSNEARERFSLQQHIRELIDLNRAIGREAHDLTAALRGSNSTQGGWGEMVLENILEQSGLTKGREFFVQMTRDAAGQTLHNDSGDTLRPDVVVRYPGDRCIVIDSKASLTAYFDYVNATDDASRREAASRHVAAIRRQMRSLGSKEYQTAAVGADKADFVMMFIPNEGAYMVAMQQEPKLWQEAYDQRVLIISPTHLISILRLVEQMWKQERVTRSVLEIAEESGKMYDKFVGFVDTLRKIGKTIDSSQSAWADAMRQLSDGRGNLVGRAEKLRRLGAKASKQLPPDMLDSADVDSDTSALPPSPSTLPNE